jgi:poly(A) polymerase
VRQAWQAHIASNIPPIPALQRAAAEVISEQVKRVAVPKRYTLVTKDIWVLQQRMTTRFGKRAYAALAHPKFRAAYDFMLLRNESGEELTELTDWWSKFQTADDTEQKAMINAVSGTRKPRRRPRKRKKKTVVQSD